MVGDASVKSPAEENVAVYEPVTSWHAINDTKIFSTTQACLRFPHFVQTASMVTGRVVRMGHCELIENIVMKINSWFVL